MAGRQGQRRYWIERERRVNTPPPRAPSGQEEHGWGVAVPATNERPGCAPDWASVRAPAPSWDSRDLSPSVPHIREPLVHQCPPPSCSPAASDPGDGEGSFGGTRDRRLERCLVRQQGAREGLALPALRASGVSPWTRGWQSGLQALHGWGRELCFSPPLPKAGK